MRSWMSSHKRIATIVGFIVLSFVLALCLRMTAFLVSKMSPASSWETVVEPGSWSPDNYRASSMAVFNDGSGEKLYVGTSNDVSGCQVRRFDGKKWAIVGARGIGNTRNREALSMAVFKSKLYVGTRNKTGCEVRRYDGGTTWTLVSNPGFGAGEANTDASSMAVFKENLYVGTWSVDGFDLYSAPDGVTWNKVTDDGFGYPSYGLAASMGVYDDGSGSMLYIGTHGAGGCGVLRYGGAGTSATVVGKEGLGDSGNYLALSFAVFESKLYVGTRNDEGCQVRRFDGENRWTLVNLPGFGKTEGNKEISALFVYRSGLYAGTGFGPGGGFVDSCQILRTDALGAEPYDWKKENVRGFTDDYNRGARSWAEYKKKLYIGTWNTDEGCGIYRTK